MRLPLEVVRGGGASLQESCETRNLSSGGVLFQADVLLEVGQLIEYKITLPPNTPKEPPVQLYCKGKVVRHQSDNEGSLKHIAATLERYEFIRADKS